MYKSASGCVEYLNIFQVSNINTTLKYLRDKNFWVYGFAANSDKDFTEIEWTGNNILFLDLKDMVLKNIQKNILTFQ